MEAIESRINDLRRRSAERATTRYPEDFKQDSLALVAELREKGWTEQAISESLEIPWVTLRSPKGSTESLTIDSPTVISASVMGASSTSVSASEPASSKPTSAIPSVGSWPEQARANNNNYANTIRRMDDSPETDGSR